MVADFPLASQEASQADLEVPQTAILRGGWHFRQEGIEYFRISKVPVERYRYRGTKILLPWMEPDEMGPVGRFANSEWNDLLHLERLQEALSG